MALQPEVFAPADEFLGALLDLSVSGVICYDPLTDAAGQVVDFAFAYVNAAAQRLLGLPTQLPTYLQQFPESVANGAFAFHCQALLAEEPRHFELDYQAGGHDTQCCLAGRRLGPHLLVSFSLVPPQDHRAVEQALRASRAREHAARTKAERQRGELQRIFEQAPVAIATYRGPTYRIELANPLVCAVWGRTPAQAVGTPLFELLPEVAGQGYEQLLAQVMATGEPYIAQEMPSLINRHGRRDTVYWNFVYLPLREENGQVTGVMAVATEVSEQVQARQQVQDLNDLLAAANQALRSSNQELLGNQEEVLLVQQQLEQLNQQLEARVAERTQQAQQALQEAQCQREQLQVQKSLLGHILKQVPAAIATLSGPEHHFSFFNDRYQALAAGRVHLALTVAEVFPEVVAQGFVGLLDQVYATGQPFQGQDMPALLHDPATGQHKQHYLDFVCQPLFDGQHRIQGILVFIADVTEKARAQQQVNALQAELLATAQLQAQARENLYQVFKQTPAAIILLRGPNHCLEYANLAYERLFPGRAQLGRPIAELQPEAMMQGFSTLLDHVYQTGETYFGNEQPLVFTPADGAPPQQLYFNFAYQAYREHGQLVGVSAFIYEVTEQVLARREADQQRQLLHTLFMEAPAPFAILDGPDYVYQLVNPAYQQIFPGRELLGKTVVAALPELHNSPIPALLACVYQTGETYRAQELPLAFARNHAGPLAEGYFTFTYQARRNAHGDVDGILVFAFEVTDQVLARRLVERSERRLQVLTDSLPALISYFDQRQRYQFNNRGYQTWFGYLPEEIMGRAVAELIGAEAYAGVQHYIERALAGEQLDFEACMPYRENFTKYIQTSFVPDWQGGHVVGCYSLVTDITEQVLARQQVQELNEELAALNAELRNSNQELHSTNNQLTRTNADLDTFIYAASHDLKAPITNIEGLLDALRDYLPADGQHPMVTRLLEMMQGSILRFQQTLGHLTDVSHLQQTLGQPGEAVALATVIEGVRLDLASLLESTQAQLVIDVAAGLDMRLPAKNLRSIIYNLLSNAVKYRATNRPPVVHLRAYRTTKQVVLEMQDNGLGLTEAQQGRLFTMFRRLHDHIEGSGVGLYMVKKIVENAAGTITVQSQLGVGSTFRVSLPLTVLSA